MVIDWEARAKLLDEENDTLREEVRNLRKALIGAAEPRPYFNKTPSEMAILGVLLNNRAPRAGSFMGALFSADADDPRHEKIPDVWICKTGRKLKPSASRSKLTRDNAGK